MRILGLAKELGVPYERLLLWCRDKGYPYLGPEEEVDTNHLEPMRRAFILGSGPKEPTLPIEELEEGDWLFDAELDIGDFPKNMEELEELERTVFKKAPSASRKKPTTDRLALNAFLEPFGITTKAARKKVRKLLPEDVARLFNHEALTEQQQQVLGKALRERVSLCCGNSICKSLIDRQSGAGELILSKNASVCRICAGSTAQRGLQEMAWVCQEAGIQRILVLGGAPSSHSELKNRTPDGLEFRLIEGDISRDKQRAVADLKWCHLMIIWGGTILGHDVSQNYSRDVTPVGLPVVQVHRRSIEALCERVVTQLRADKKK